MPYFLFCLKIKCLRLSWGSIIDATIDGPGRPQIENKTDQTMEETPFLH